MVAATYRKRRLKPPATSHLPSEVVSSFKDRWLYVMVILLGLIRMGHALVFSLWSQIGLTSTLGLVVYLWIIDRNHVPKIECFRMARIPRLKERKIKMRKMRNLKRKRGTRRKRKQIQLESRLLRIILSCAIDDKLHNSLRSEIAAILPSSHKRISAPKRKWYFDVLWRFIPFVKYTSSHCMRSMIIYLRSVHHRRCYNMMATADLFGRHIRRKNSEKILLDTIERTNLMENAKESSTAFCLLAETLNYPAHDPLRVVNVCLSVIAIYGDKGVNWNLAMWSKLAFCLNMVALDWNNDDDDDDEEDDDIRCIPEVLSAIVMDQNALRFLLYGLSQLKDDNTHRQSIDEALTYLCCNGTDEQRLSISIEHKELFKKVMPNIGVSSLDYYSSRPEYAQLMIETPAVLNTIYIMLNGGCERYERDQIKRAIRRLFLQSIDDSRLLQNLLGYGFMNDSTWRYGEEFTRRFLQLHPEWINKYKSMTFDDGGEMEAMRRSIPDRPRFPPTQYYLQQEEEYLLPTLQHSIPTETNRDTNEEYVKQEKIKDQPPTFFDLPPNFIIQVARTMTFSEMKSFRLSCTKGLIAVDHIGSSMRKLCITSLVRKMWPDKLSTDKSIDTIYLMQKELIRISQWRNFDLVTLIDFEGIGTLNSAQLESIFGSEQYLNVNKINLIGVVAMPTVWTTLSLLFPRLMVIRCTESTSQFPAEILTEVMRMDGTTICGKAIIDRREHQMRGVLGQDRMITLRSLKCLFPHLSCIFID